MASAHGWLVGNGVILTMAQNDVVAVGSFVRGLIYLPWPDLRACPCRDAIWWPEPCPVFCLSSLHVTCQRMGSLASLVVTHRAGIIALRRRRPRSPKFHEKRAGRSFPAYRGEAGSWRRGGSQSVQLSRTDVMVACCY